MANLVRSRSWGQIKPLPGARIDRGSPFAQDLAHCFVFNEENSRFVNLAGEYVPTLNGGSLLDVTPQGVRFNNAVSTQYIASPAVGYDLTKGFSMDCLVYVEANTKGHFVYGRTASSGSSGVAIGIGVSDSDNVGGNLVFLDEGVAWQGSGIAIPKNQLVHFGLSFNAQKAVVGYMGGRSVKTFTSSAGVDATRGFVVGGSPVVASRTATVRIATARMWYRPLASAEFQHLAREPYAMFAAPGPKFWYFALPGNAGQIATIGQALETDTAQPIGRLKSKAVSQAAEGDTAFAITPKKVKLVGQTVESDIAQTLLRIKTKQLGQALETDSATAIAKKKTRTVGLVTEQDLANGVTGGASHGVGMAIETDSAMPLTKLKKKLVQQAVELDSTFGLLYTKRKILGIAIELDTAFGVTTPGLVFFNMLNLHQGWRVVDVSQDWSVRGLATGWRITDIEVE